MTPLNLEQFKIPPQSNQLDLNNFKINQPPLNTQTNALNQESALMPANPIKQTGFFDALKIIPNAVGDIYNLIKQGTIGTASNLIDIPKEAVGLLQDTKGNVGEAIGNMLNAVPKETLNAVWSMVPQSAKKLANVQAIGQIPAAVHGLIKDSGGWTNAAVTLGKSIPDSLSPAMQNYLEQIDKSRQDIVNHPVNEVLGYLLFKQLYEHPGETGQQVRQAFQDVGAGTKEALNHPIQTFQNAIENARFRVDSLKSQPTPEELAGKITQAKTPYDIQTATRGLSSLSADDIQAVKEGENLSSILNDKIKSNLGKVDIELGKSTSQLKPEDLTQINGQIETDYVSQSLEQLKNYYNKINSPVKETKIANLQTKYTDEGLTPKEINQIAREHGTNLNAYNANGELASGLTKQAAENTRAGVKGIVQDLMPNADTQVLDKQTSDLIKTKEMVDDLNEKAQALQNKWKSANIFQKTAGYVGKGIDLMTGGVIRGLWRGIMGYGNVEGSRLNPIQIQNNIPKYLELFDKLNQMAPETSAKILLNPNEYKIPLTNESPYTKNVPINMGTKIPVENLTPDEVQILKTIRYKENIPIILGPEKITPLFSQELAIKRLKELGVLPENKEIANIPTPKENIDFSFMNELVKEGGTNLELGINKLSGTSKEILKMFDSLDSETQNKIFPSLPEKVQNLIYGIEGKNISLKTKVIKDIKALGGIKAYPNGFMKEEMGALPPSVYSRNPSAQVLDAMLKDLAEFDPHTYGKMSTDDLLEIFAKNLKNK